MVFDVMLTSKGELPDRQMRIARVKMFSKVAQGTADLSSNQPQSSEDLPTIPGIDEDSESTSRFESSTEGEDLFSFLSFGSFENP
jgi:hypothetical protein